VKADPVLIAGRQQCHKRYGESMAHHRGLRAGHEIQRDSPGTWEIQISPCGESKVAGDPAGERNPGAHGEAPPHGRVPRAVEDTNRQEGQSKVPGR